MLRTERVEVDRSKDEAGPAARAYSLPRARQALKSRIAEDRLRAVQELGRLDSPEASALLVEALKDRLSFIAAAAAQTLARRMTPRIADAMIDHFCWASEDGPKRDPGCSARIEIAIALGNISYARAEPVFRLGMDTTQVEMVGFGLEDTAVGLRANCAIGLAQIRAAGALLDISLLLFDAGPQVSIDSDTTVARKAAAKAIGALGDPAGSVPLAIKLKMPLQSDPEVLVECMSSLVAIEDPRALELISPFLEQPHSFVAAGAAAALGRSRRPEALPYLLLALDGAGSDLAAVIAAAIGTLRLPEARAALLERTGTGRRIQRAACALALTHFPDSEVRRHLESLASDAPDEQVRRAAVQALEAHR